MLKHASADITIKKNLDNKFELRIGSTEELESLLSELINLLVELVQEFLVLLSGKSSGELLVSNKISHEPHLSLIKHLLMSSSQSGSLADDISCEVLDPVAEILLCDMSSVELLSLIFLSLTIQLSSNILLKESASLLNKGPEDDLIQNVSPSIYNPYCPFLHEVWVFLEEDSKHA